MNQARARDNHLNDRIKNKAFKAEASEMELERPHNPQNPQQSNNHLEFLEQIAWLKS